MRTWLKALALYAAALASVAALLFVPAGTLDYWQAWLYMAVMFIPAACVMAYFLASDPSFLEKRFRMKEKEREQKALQAPSAIIFLAGFLAPGICRRYGILDVPDGMAIAAEAAVLAGYALVFLVFKENSFAGRTIMVEKGQKVISTGPYALVRHPMYAGVLLMYIATPIALGSYLALIPFLFIIPLLACRIKNEEEVLARGLKGYREYCAKVKWRMVPGVW
ncbi:MAG: isoprenylcysteine carboxylmethyltransferase family protein [Candidatus Micrarchaeia archaeon]|jgi:protein-S-isoprenylcysteine O-methyltransferase Ste14